MSSKKNLHQETIRLHQADPILDLYLHEHTTGLITVTSDLNIGDTDIPVAAGHGAVAGEYICLKENGRYYQGRILVAAATSLTVDTPLDYAYSASSICTATSIQLAVNGSVTPVIFHIKPAAGIIWDITRMIFYIEDNAAMDDSLFGSIAALTNGIVVRKKDGTYKNIFNIKSNGEFGLRAYDADYTTPNLPTGTYGFRCRRSFNGDDKNATVIRLDGDLDDELEIIIQDDLTALSKFYVVAQGHISSEDV